MKAMQHMQATFQFWTFNTYTGGDASTTYHDRMSRRTGRHRIDLPWYNITFRGSTVTRLKYLSQTWLALLIVLFRSHSSHVAHSSIILCQSNCTPISVCSSYLPCAAFYVSWTNLGTKKKNLQSCLRHRVCWETWSSILTLAVNLSKIRPVGQKSILMLAVWARFYLNTLFLFFLWTSKGLCWRTNLLLYRETK